MAAPSGAGKSSFVERICRENDRLVDTVTYTTRKPRAGEYEGNPYHFVSNEKFESFIKDNFFVEWARVHTNFYGTPLYQLTDAWKAKKAVIMDVDIQGWDTFKRKFPKAFGVFILPPSFEELRRRITRRDGRIPEDLEVRMKNAESEVKRASEFDVQIVNDVFEVSYLEFKKVVESYMSRELPK